MTIKPREMSLNSLSHCLLRQQFSLFVALFVLGLVLKVLACDLNLFRMARLHHVTLGLFHVAMPYLVYLVYSLFSLAAIASLLEKRDILKNVFYDNQICHC